MDTEHRDHAPRPVSADERRSINPYLDLTDASQPLEISRFELETDPYRNSLPGMSSVHAARTVGHGLRAGRNGSRALLIVSLLLVAVIVLPAVAAVIAQLVR